MNPKKILLILTGGTICSFATPQGEQASDTAKAQALMIQKFRESSCPYADESQVTFTCVSPLDVLSENMTPAHWNVLQDSLKAYDFSAYDGVIMLHGTDTLAYTASMLSILLSGCKIPVILVSSQLALSNPQANGVANFKAAVELIVNGISPNVYATYRNQEKRGDTTEQVVYLHYGAHLLQCANRSDNFYSADMIPLSAENASHPGTACVGDMPFWKSHDFQGFSANVLRIQPYVGLDYRHFSTEGVDAILHGTYHSSTMATDPSLGDQDSKHHSIMYLKAMCDSHTPPIPLFLEPYVQTTYETTGDALRGGILPIKGLTSEMAYVKTLMGCSMGLSGTALLDFINTDINGEHLPR